MRSTGRAVLVFDLGCPGETLVIDAFATTVASLSSPFFPSPFAVVCAGMASWGSQKVSSLNVSKMVVLPSMLKILQRIPAKHDIVAYEIALAVHRLVKTYGASLGVRPAMLGACWFVCCFNSGCCLPPVICVWVGGTFESKILLMPYNIGEHTARHPFNHTRATNPDSFHPFNHPHNQPRLRSLLYPFDRHGSRSGV